MASERSQPPTDALTRPPAVYVDALRAWRALAGRALRASGLDQPMIAHERADLRVYAGATVALLLTAVPFWLASADGVVPGFASVPAPGVWDALGRARALVAEGPLPLGPGPGPTSPLWTWLIAIPYGLVGWTGLSVAVIAKVLSWAFAFLSVVVFYNLALLGAGARWPGVLAVALIALDPALAFGRVAGGETALFVTLAGLACLAAARGRLGLLSCLLAGLVLARPDGVALVILTAVVLAVELLWRRGELSRDAGRDIGTLAWLIAPSAVALGLWALHGLIADGSPLPLLWQRYASGPRAGTVLVTARALWDGYLGAHPSFATGFAAVTLATWAWAAWTYCRAWGVRGALPALMPFATAVSVLASGAPRAPWTYDVRRLAEPMLPWLALGLALGLAAAGRFIWQRSGGGLAFGSLRVDRWPLDRVVACLPLVFWLLSGGLLWVRSTVDYAWGGRNVAELPVAAGQWIAANALGLARVGIAPGAEPVRGGDRRPTRDVLPDQDGSWSEARAIAQEEGLGYLVAYRGTAPSTWPMAREVVRLGSQRNVALPAPELAVYRLDWNLARLDNGQPAMLQLDGYAVVDELDVGDDASETRHFYSSASRGVRVHGEVGVPGGWLADVGRAQDPGRGSESFILAARPQRDVMIGVRYGNGSGGTLRLDVGGETFELRLRDCGTLLCEDVAVVPSGRVRTPTVRINTAFVGPAGGPIATYHYWSIVGATDR